MYMIFQLLLVAICHAFSAHLMATIEDASMPDALVIEIIVFLNVLLSGSKQTVRNLEDMVKRKQNMYNLEEWEEFE